MWNTVIAWSGGSFKFHTETSNLPKMKEIMDRYIADGYRTMCMTGFRTKTQAERWAKGLMGIGII